MTLFSYTSQVENDCNAKSTNGFIVLWYLSISRASNRNVCEKPSNEREMHRTESNIMFAPPKSTNNIKSGEFPQLFRACFTQTQWLPVDDTSWKIILFRYCFESSGWWKKEWRAQTISHLANGYKFRERRNIRLIVDSNSITCAGSTETKANSNQFIQICS